jgi:hypothetical protein
MESKVAIAEPVMPYNGINTIFNTIVKKTSIKPRNNTIL